MAAASVQKRSDVETLTRWPRETTYCTGRRHSIDIHDLSGLAELTPGGRAARPMTSMRCMSIFQARDINAEGNVIIRCQSRHHHALPFFHKQQSRVVGVRPAPHRIAVATPACVKVIDTLISNTTSQISNTRASKRPPRRVKVSTMRCWNCGGSFIGAYLAPTAMAAIIARQWLCRRWHRE
jgi:hypothetical protein